MNSNPNPHILSDSQIELTYEKIANPATPIAELSVLKKTLHNSLAKEVGSTWEKPVHQAGVKKVLDAINSTTEPDRLVELLRSIGCMYYYFSAPPEFILTTKKLIFSNLEHNSGKVREATRRIVGNWRLHDNSSHKNDVDEGIKDFIRNLVVLIKKYEPITETGTIENMPPSIYKTLLLTYQEIVRGRYTEQWVGENPDLQIYIPYDDSTPVVNRSTLIPLLWKRHIYTKTTLDKSANISQRAYQSLLGFLSRAGYSTTEVNDIRSRLAMTDSHDTELALVEYIIKTAMNKQIDPTPLGPIIRELQTFTNFKIRSFQDIPFTYVLLSAQAERIEQKIKGSVNWNEWFLHVSAVYEAIEKFYEQECKSKEKYVLDMAQFMKNVNLDYDIEEEKKQYLADLDDARSVAHYIWSWLVQSYPTLTRKTVEKHAALCYGVVQEINEGLVPYSLSDLGKFGGWKSSGSMKYSVLNYVSLLQEVVPDFGLLILQRASSSLDEEYKLNHPDDRLDALKFESPLGDVAPNYPRYFIVLSGTINISNNEFERFKKALMDETKTKSCILDTVSLHTNYIFGVIGIRHDNAPQDVVDNLIITANGSNPFLRYHSLIINTHIPTSYEIDDYLKSFLF